MRRYNEAEPLCSAAVAILEQSLGPANPNVATALMLQAQDFPPCMYTKTIGCSLHPKSDASVSNMSCIYVKYELD